MRVMILIIIEYIAFKPLVLTDMKCGTVGTHWKQAKWNVIKTALKEIANRGHVKGKFRLMGQYGVGTAIIGDELDCLAIIASETDLYGKHEFISTFNKLIPKTHSDPLAHRTMVRGLSTCTSRKSSKYDSAFFL
jgi:hypothetical protein